MSLPLFDAFCCPYEIWSKRNPTPEERIKNQYSVWEILDGINDKVEKTISSPFEAARHMVEEGMDNALAHFIEDALNKSTAFKSWRRKMPSSIPKNIEKYQKSYPSCNLDAVDAEINNVGYLPSEGQYFFHGGFLFEDGVLAFNTSKPLSTTLCPQVALREAEFKGKAYDQGEIHLYVLKVVNPRTKVYVFKNNGSNLGHEKEVLFGARANLQIVHKTLITDSYSVSKFEYPAKEVPAYVFEITIS